MGESMAREGVEAPWVNGPEKRVSRRSKVPPGKFRSPPFEIPKIKITPGSDSGRNRPRAESAVGGIRHGSRLTPPWLPPGLAGLERFGMFDIQH